MRFGVTVQTDYIRWMILSRADGKPHLITLTADDIPAKFVGKKANELKPGKMEETDIPGVFAKFFNFFRTWRCKFKDLNGDGVIDNGSASLSDHGDLDIIGNSNPRYVYGFRIGADYKGFDLSLFFQGVGSREEWGQGFLAIPGFNF